MPALTFKGNLVNLSYVDDALTFYPNFSYYEEDSGQSLRNCLKVFKQCNKLNFVISRLNGYHSTQNNERFISCLEQIQAGKICSYDKYVIRTDDDHLLYHRDSYNLNDSHWHIKFRRILNKDQLATILNIFENSMLITHEEKLDFLAAFDQRYIECRNRLDRELDGICQEDVGTVIINFVNRCSDNDILSDLHKYLLEEKFDFIRAVNGSEIPRFQGCNRQGQVVPTHIAWAKIEKAIAVQMVHNIQKQCTDFSPRLAKVSAKRLGNQCSFFAIPRKAKHGPNAKSKLYIALKTGPMI
jgi:hypothetical protein